MQEGAVLAAIDRDELVRLVLDLCNIPAPIGTGREAGDFVFDWMRREGFAPRRAGMTEERFNVIGSMGGHGDGPNLLFTSHLDTESPLYHADDRFSLRPETASDPQWLSAWLEGERFFGHAVGNDRGPMACFLIAAKALVKAGVKLSGTLYLTACPGEIGPEPAEEHQGVAYLGKEVGAQYMLAHGGVAPDFAIAAEGTDFGVNWVACGYANYCITLFGEAVFTPLLTHPPASRAHPNPIVRMAALIEVLQLWASDYEVRNRYAGRGGTAIPKVQIGRDPRRQRPLTRRRQRSVLDICRNQPDAGAIDRRRGPQPESRFARRGSGRDVDPALRHAPRFRSRQRCRRAAAPGPRLGPPDRARIADRDERSGVFQHVARP